MPKWRSGLWNYQLFPLKIHAYSMGSDLKNKFLVYLWIWDFNEMAHILKEHFYGMYLTNFQINLKVNSELLKWILHLKRNSKNPRRCVPFFAYKTCTLKLIKQWKLKRQRDTRVRPVLRSSLRAWVSNTSRRRIMITFSKLHTFNPSSCISFLY